MDRLFYKGKPLSKGNGPYWRLSELQCDSDLIEEIGRKIIGKMTKKKIIEYLKSRDEILVPLLSNEEANFQMTKVIRRHEVQFEPSVSHEKCHTETSDNFVVANSPLIARDWDEVQPPYRLKIGIHGFDIRVLVSILGSGLNQALNTRPYPQYPSNPYNRIPLVRDDFKHLILKVECISILINIALREFLVNLEFFESAESISNEYEKARYISELFEVRGLRYRLINATESQGNFIGCWVPRNTPLTDFELGFVDYDISPLDLKEIYNPESFDIERDYLVKIR